MEMKKYERLVQNRYWSVEKGKNKIQKNTKKRIERQERKKRWEAMNREKQERWEGKGEKRQETGS